MTAWYLGRNGVSVREHVVRAWHDKCSLYTPEELNDVETEGGAVARPLVTEVTRLIMEGYRGWKVWCRYANTSYAWRIGVATNTNTSA